MSLFIMDVFSFEELHGSFEELFSTSQLYQIFNKSEGR